MNTPVLHLRFPTGRIDLGGPPPPTSSIELARHLPDCAGRAVLDLGCGSGLFAIAAARKKAREVWAVDIDPEACEWTRRNAEANGVAVRVEQGDLFAPVAGRRFDLIVTNPPQTPAPEGARHPKFAGPDGLAVFERILREARGHLHPGGQVLTMLISLADTKRFRELASGFEVRSLGEMQREFTPEEYDGYAPGLWSYLRGREHEAHGGRRYFKIRFFLLT